MTTDAELVPRGHCASRLPYRHADLLPTFKAGTATVPLHHNHHYQRHRTYSSPKVATSTSSSAAPSTATASPLQSRPATSPASAASSATATARSTPAAIPRAAAPAKTNTKPPLPTSPPAPSNNPPAPRQIARNAVTALHSRNGSLSSWSGPPPTMLTQRAFKTELTPAFTSTTDWVDQQSIPLTPTRIVDDAESRSSQQPPPSKPAVPLIPPIRGFKSSLKSANMSRSSMEQDDQRDLTLRALQGLDHVKSPRTSKTLDLDEQNSDDSDLFLKLAREEELAQLASNANAAALSRSNSRRSRIGQRESIPPTDPLSPSTGRRRGSEHDNSYESRLMEEQQSIAQVLTYRPSPKDRAPTALDINRSRYPRANSLSNPTTPRGSGTQGTPQLSHGFYGGRPSAPEPNSVLPSRATAYRQSNLSYSAPRTYNSSPLVSNTTDLNDAPGAQRAAEGTESTVSTTAPSTVWDELEDLKSRIHRLELTGKLPATSGAAISRASNERPATATTTVTTISSSPKQGRGNSISPTDSTGVFPSTGGESHPLLYSALAKSQPLLSPEVYKALEATASDALAITSMTGSSGHSGPISSSQSTIGGGLSAISDRQLRRKADSMCRSLTELCLALSEGKTQQAQPATSQTLAGPKSQDAEMRSNSESNNVHRQPVSNDLSRVKSHPRALSRLEARRSSLLAGSSLPGTRYAPSEAGTPTQASSAGRQTSLLLRSRRGGTEEPEEEDESRFRAPSRAATEIGRLRNSPREYVSQQPLPGNRSTPAQPPLVKRHYVSTSLSNTAVPPLPTTPGLVGRKYLGLSTPERDTTSVAGRLAEDRAQRKSSVGQGFSLGRTSSLTMRRRQPYATDSSTAAQAGGY